MASSKPKFPAVLVHPDLSGVEITAASPSSLKAHEANGWKRKTSKTSTPKTSES